MKKKVKKMIKKTNKTLLISSFIFLLLGFIGGYYTVNFLTQNDVFEIKGEKNITLNINENYIEEGVKAISFGKDFSKNVIIESTLDTSKEGTYAIIYTIKDSFKYKNIKRVRYVTIVNGSDTNE